MAIAYRVNLRTFRIFSFAHYRLRKVLRLWQNFTFSRDWDVDSGWSILHPECSNLEFKSKATTSPSQLISVKADNFVRQLAPCWKEMKNSDLPVCKCIHWPKLRPKLMPLDHWTIQLDGLNFSFIFAATSSTFSARDYSTRAFRWALKNEDVWRRAPIVSLSDWNVVGVANFYDFLPWNASRWV